MKLISLFKKKVIFFSLTTLIFSVCITLNSVYEAKADTASQIRDLQNKISALSSKIQSEQSQINDYNNKISNAQSNINNMNNIISEKTELINETQQKIDLLNQQITETNTEIADLTQKINDMYTLFIARANESYEDSYVNPIYYALGQKNITDSFISLEYFATTRDNDSKLISDYKNSKFVLDEKLTSLSSSQKDLSNTQADLQKQKNDLVNQKNSLNNMVASYSAQKNQTSNQINNDESQLQQLLNQINSLQIDGYSGSGSCVKGNYWYYNQQCYGRLAGMNGTSIDMTYGCLITDIAMVATKLLGGQYNPPYVAAHTWFNRYNWMMAWPTIPGIQYSSVGGNTSSISSQLAQGNPVIVHLNAPHGEHWVVFYQQVGNDYLINDPWYGSGLHFLGTDNNSHQYYSTSQIDQAFIMTL